MNNRYEDERSYGYYSGNSNIFQTLVDAAFDSAVLLGKASWGFFKWTMDGWIDWDKQGEKYNKVNVKRDCIKFFDNSNLKINNEMPIYIEEGETDYLYYYKFKLPLGMCIRDFEKQNERFAAFLKCETRDIRFEQEDNNLLVLKLKHDAKYIYDPVKYKRNDFKIPVGYNKSGKLLLIDLLTSDHFGVYIAGSSGAGKSVTLRLILCHLVNSLSPEDLELVIVNTKSVDLDLFKYCEHTIRYTEGSEDIVVLLKSLINKEQNNNNNNNNNNNKKKNNKSDNNIEEIIEKAEEATSEQEKVLREMLKDYLQFEENNKEEEEKYSDIVTIMAEQVIEMNKRLKLIKQNGYDNIWEAREKGLHIPFRVVVIEELAAYEHNKDFHKLLKALSDRARASGVLLICTCQFPNKDVLPSGTKCNFSTIFGHRTSTDLISEVIAGKDSGLEKLTGNGHNKIFACDYPGEEYQGLYIDKETMKSIVCNKK